MYGVFKYTIDYSHSGYSYLNLVHQVPVRPFRHDEYEVRMVPCGSGGAYPILSPAPHLPSCYAGRFVYLVAHVLWLYLL